MYEKSIRSIFSNLNIPKQEKIKEKENPSYEDKLKKAAEHLAQFADFHGIINKLESIKEEEKRKTDPVLNFLYQLKRSSY
ncbi:MAG: hypothetical protein Q8930_05890 [Bacillota bacterium]|nr:hypothetical protein [Bacillota bacterium]